MSPGRAYSLVAAHINDPSIKSSPSSQKRRSRSAFVISLNKLHLTTRRRALRLLSNIKRMIAVYRPLFVPVRDDAPPDAKGRSGGEGGGDRRSVPIKTVGPLFMAA